MRLLLDTHLLLWGAAEPETMPPGAFELIEDPDNQLYFSAASIWEIAIKHGAGRPGFTVDPRLFRRRLLECDYTELPITGAHAMVVDLLPPIHRDPFDRLLVAQAQAEAVTLLTADRTLGRYPGPVHVV